MKSNYGRQGISSLSPYGTNSTMFTLCCGSAICNDERCCPSCGEEVIGADEPDYHKRGIIRWRYATSSWSRK